MMTRILAALGFVAVGAIGLAVVQSVWPSSSVADHANTLSSLDAPPPSAAPSASDGILRLSPEAVARAGIRVEAVGRGGIAQPLRMPATVEPDGYRTVEVTTLLPGTVLDMPVRLGDVIRAGTVVGRLRSPALTDEVRRWLTLRAERDVAASRLARTRRLAEIGAASRGDLEEDEAADVRAATDLTGAHARLVRLGLGEPRLAELVDGAPLYRDYEMHFMVTQGLRDRRTLRVNYPLEGKSRPGGETNPATQQIDFYIRSPQTNPKNRPGREVFAHFFGMEITWK